MTWRSIGIYLKYLKALRHGPPLFQLPLGEVVFWAGKPASTQPWRIVAQRLTRGEVSAYVEYLLVSQGEPTASTAWGYEPDCLPFNLDDGDE